jgi:hypothetical protein
VSGFVVADVHAFKLGSVPAPWAPTDIGPNEIARRFFSLESPAVPAQFARKRKIVNSPACANALDRVDAPSPCSLGQVREFAVFRRHRQVAWHKKASGLVRKCPVPF